MNPAIQSRIEENVAAIGAISRHDLAQERRLHSTKWFDYRFTSALRATLQFRGHYQRVYRQKYRVNIDADEADHKTGVRGGLAMDHRREFTAFWRARQFADELGVPYDLFLEGAFEVMIRDGWTRLPHPNQLYGDHRRDRIEAAVMALWQERMDSELTICRDPKFRTESFKRMPAQFAHRKWVIEQLKTRNRQLRTGIACFLHRAVCEQDVIETFGKDTLELARGEVAGMEPSPNEPCPGSELLPSCLGLPGALEPGSEECIQCPLLRLCVRLENDARQDAIDKFETDDPISDRRKMLQRERVRRHRAKAAKTAAAAKGLSYS
jgi:hypothetical protein